MEVKVAKTAGFCFGVQRAVDKVYELIDSCPDRLFTLGPIIHNEEVVNDLEKKGVRVQLQCPQDFTDSRSGNSQ